MLKGHRNKSVDATTRPFLLSYSREQEPGYDDQALKEVLRKSRQAKYSSTRNIYLEQGIGSNKKAKLHHIPQYYYGQDENYTDDFTYGRRNSDYLLPARKDQENRRPTVRRSSKNLSNYKASPTHSPIRYQIGEENRTAASVQPSNFIQTRNINDFCDHPRSPIPYKQRYSIGPTHFELISGSSCAPSSCRSSCTPADCLPPSAIDSRLKVKDDYGFANASTSSKIQPGKSLRRESSSIRQPSLTPSYKRSSATPSVTGTLTRSVARVMKRRKHVVLLGLDGSGKTTILMRLKFNAKFDTSPTVGFNHEKIWAGGYRWSAWDVGGGERVRSLWGTYTRGTDGVVFVVDASANSDTMEEARLELARIMKLAKAIAVEMGRAPPPLLVMANFQDRKHARTAPAVAKCLSLPVEGETPPTGAVPAACWAVACVCAVSGDGLDEAFATLRHLIDNGAQPAKRRKISADWWR